MEYLGSVRHGFPNHLLNKNMRFQTDFPLQIPSATEALPGRSQALRVTNAHHVHQRTIQPPFPPDCRKALFGLGCFWGAEQIFWQLDGVHTTAVGYSGGMTPNPTYEEVCSGLTGHSEVVQVVYKPAQIDYLSLLCVFWEAHDPTQGMRQGHDIGTQYRSSIYTLDSDQAQVATESKQHYGKSLAATGRSGITTEIAAATAFYYAEDYHQQYLSKNPAGYCGLSSTGVRFG
jgi:peptide-methionine (S)-S-oxide reductase